MSRESAVCVECGCAHVFVVARIDAQGQLGIGSLNNVSLPTLVALPADVTVSVIATGLDHACALTTGSYSQPATGELIAQAHSTLV